MTQTTVSAFILAAGLGTRMKSTRAKVLHMVLFKPMIHHVVETVNSIGFDKVFVVVGHQKEEVMAVLDNFQVSFVVQDEQLGTGHAVLCAEDQLQDIGGTVMILSGDVPLISKDSIEKMLAKHQDSKPALTIMTTQLDDPTNYGRILRNKQGQILAIIEEKDATAEQRKINEINAGIYCAEVPFLFEALRKVGTDNSQGEIYLTDIVKIAIDMGQRVEIFGGASAEEVLGVNSKSELAAANKYLQARHDNKLAEE
jgi:bifunctional UDP-N-acetylglucosamine pyrophosphorylase/glucosamine-1-phosphate N-acetyltransferase